ncbi:MAG TPA: hypothetical protein VGK46_02655 [Saprospiraceae bacterium]
MISLIHPSRGRPKQSFETMIKWLSKSSGDVQLDLVLSLDCDDPVIDEYYKLYENLGRSFLWEDNLNTSAVDAINKGAKECVGDILVIVSDDSDCPDRWDARIANAMSGKSGVLKTFDGVQKWIVTMPVMTRDYYESKGYIYHPDYTHMFCDTHLTHVADLEKKLIFRNDLVFPHNHYSTGKSKKDAVNIKNDSTWAQGEAAYLRHCRNKFGMSVDIFNLSKEAHQAGHVAWLKKKLR